MASLHELEPWLRPHARWFEDYLTWLGLHPRVTSVFRSRRVQELLYRRYLRGQSDFPAAPPGKSWHEYRRAFDLVCDDQGLAGQIWKQMGGSWWLSDPVHFQA